MDISKIDKNFNLETEIDSSDLTWLELSDPRIKVYGAVGLSPVTRMPIDVAEKVSDGVAALNYNTAGVRVKIRTNSSKIAIHAEWDHKNIMAHMPSSGSSGFDLYRIKDGEYRLCGTYIPPCQAPTTFKGIEGVCNVGSNMCDYVINFPLYNDVQKFYIGVEKNAEFETPAAHSNEGYPVVYYGSSITQGGCASRPGNAYQGYLSRKFNLDFVNLGFSGNAKGEPVMAEYIAGLNMSAFVLDYDHNAPTADHLEATHYNFYKIIRDKNPDLPIIMLTRPSFTAGGPDTIRRREIIKATYNKALENGDKNINFVDGADIYDIDGGDSMSVDLCHPTDVGFYRFYEVLKPVFEKLFG